MLGLAPRRWHEVALFSDASHTKLRSGLLSQAGTSRPSSQGGDYSVNNSTVEFARLRLRRQWELDEESICGDKISSKTRPIDKIA